MVDSSKLYTKKSLVILLGNKYNRSILPDLHNWDSCRDDIEVLVFYKPIDHHVNKLEIEFK